MPDAPPRTHRVAVAAYVFHGDRVLLLRRAHPPRTLAPPGGHLDTDEDPLAGLERELLEETGQKIRVLGIAHTWFGSIDGVQAPILGIDFIAEMDDPRIVLCSEHSECLWASREQIERGDIQTLTAEGYGYAPEYLLTAFRLYERLKA